MTETNDLAERLLDQGIVMLGGKLDQAAADRVTVSLLALDARKPDRGFAEMHLASAAGAVGPALALHDVIAQLATEVHVIASGVLDTAGALILLAGTHGHRLMLPNARIHLRQPEEPTIGDLSLESAANEVTYLRDRAESLLGTPLRPPRLLDAQEAIALGIADAIAKPKERK
jgi:ATP-dependent Clp protease protease subunit